MEDVVIIGAGLAGAATAWHLTQRGQQVTVLERTVPANAFGSSHGSARIFRYAYPQQLYADLVVRSRSGWDELERLSGRILIDPVGCANAGELHDLQEMAAVLDRAGAANELIPAAEARERWPQFNFGGEILWQPDAGVLDPQTTIETMLELAVNSNNARVLTDWQAARIERMPTGYRVHSADGQSVEGSRIVVAAGAWLPEMLDGFGLPAEIVAALPTLKVQQEQIFHFPYREEVAPRATWPTLIDFQSNIDIYGLPGGRDGEFRGQKIAQMHGGRKIASASAQDGVVSAENRKRVTAYVSEFLPGLDPDPYAEATCLFTTTPTEDFIFETRDGVTLVSACSGHGAKFAPLLGELAADLALGTGSVPNAFRLPHTV